MLASILFAVLIALSFAAAKSDQQFDALFPHDPTQLSYVRADKEFTFPDNIVNFTICFWVKPSAETQLSVFTYNAFPSAEWGNELGIYLESQLSKSWLCLHEKCIEFPGPKVRPNAWHHICMLYDGSNPKVTLFYNGDQKYEAYGDRREKNYEIRGKGIFLLGQDQDNYGGKFEASQSMRGLLTRLQMWDRVLDETEVKQQLECNAQEGNVIAWTKIPWLFLQGATKEINPTCPAISEREDDECACNGAKMATLTKTTADIKMEFEEQRAELKEKIQKLEENNEVLMDVVDQMEKNREDILELKGRNEVLEREMKKNQQINQNTVALKEELEAMRRSVKDLILKNNLKFDGKSDTDFEHNQVLLSQKE